MVKWDLREGFRGRDKGGKNEGYVVMRSRKTGAAVRRVGESLAGGKWGRGNGQAGSGPGRVRAGIGGWPDTATGGQIHVVHISHTHPPKEIIQALRKYLLGKILLARIGADTAGNEPNFA